MSNSAATPAGGGARKHIGSERVSATQQARAVLFTSRKEFCLVQTAEYGPCSGGGGLGATESESIRAAPAPLVPGSGAAGARSVAMESGRCLRSCAHRMEVRLLRLLDHIAQCSAPFVVQQDQGDVWRLTGASAFAVPLARCPLRYVLADDLVRTCTALAYSDGDELSGCLDLLHIPAESLWIEWNDAARRDELARVLPECTAAPAVDIMRAGTLISSQPGGRSGSLRTFFLSRSEPQEPLLAAVETLLALDGGLAAAPADSLLEGHTIAVRDPSNRQVDDLLRCAGFRLEPSWLKYYRSIACSAATREQIIQRSLAAVVFDIPILLALFLLMSIRADLVHMPITPSRLNAKRARLGKQPLLEHIEVSAPVFASAPRYHGEGVGASRRGPRFHHVRGHIVRRRNTVYWRGPHWRGHVRLGSVLSRTVDLRLPGCGATRGHDDFS